MHGRQRPGKEQGAGMTGKQVLIAEAVVLGGLTLALLAKELPGAMREVRIWRMVGLRSGGRHPR